MADYQFSRMPVLTPPVQTDYRRIQMLIPVPESRPILAELERYESHSMHGQMPFGLGSLPRAFRYTMRGVTLGSTSPQRSFRPTLAMAIHASACLTDAVG